MAMNAGDYVHNPFQGSSISRRSIPRQSTEDDDIIKGIDDDDLKDIDLNNLDDIEDLLK